MKLLCLLRGHDEISVGYGINSPHPGMGYNLLECRRCKAVRKAELGFLSKFLLKNQPQAS